jgi:hypothetical protein
MTSSDQVSKAVPTETKKTRRTRPKKFKLVMIGFRAFRQFSGGGLEMDGVGVPQQVGG